MPERKPSTRELEAIELSLGQLEDPTIDYSMTAPHEEFAVSRQRVLNAAETAARSLGDDGEHAQAMGELNDAVAEMAVRYVDAIKTGCSEAEQIDLAASLIYIAATDLKSLVDRYNPTKDCILHVNGIGEYHGLIAEMFKNGRGDSLKLGDSLVDTVVQIYAPALGTWLYRLSNGRDTK